MRLSSTKPNSHSITNTLDIATRLLLEQKCIVSLLPDEPLASTSLLARKSSLRPRITKARPDHGSRHDYLFSSAVAEEALT